MYIMKPQNITVNFELTLDANNDSVLYRSIRDTPIDDCGALLREYIDAGISAEYTEFYIEQRIRSGIAAEIKSLKSTTSEQQ